MVRRDQRRYLLAGALGFLVLMVPFIRHRHSRPSPSALLDRVYRVSNRYQNILSSDYDDQNLYEVNSPDAASNGRIVRVNTPTTVASTFLYNKPSITIHAQTHGFAVYDHLYLRNGTFYIVTDDPSQFLDREDILSDIVVKVSGVDVNLSGQVRMRNEPSGWIMLTDV
mgnify:FL=1